MVRWPWQKTKTQPLFLGEQLKTKPDRGYIYHIADRLYGWREKVAEFDRYYDNHPEVKSQILSIAGQSTAKGVFLEPASESGHAAEAVKKCKQLNDDVGIDHLLYETFIPLAKYGTVLWEKTWSPDANLQLIPIVKDYRPYDYELFTVKTWELLSNGTERVPRLFLGKDRFAEFSWNVTATSWPFGTSLLSGLGQTLAITEQLIDDIQEYFHKAAFPISAVQIGDNESRPDPDDLATYNNLIKNAVPGQKFTTSYELNHVLIGPGAAETQMLPPIIEYLKDRLVDGLMMAPVSKQYSRTMASMEQMQDTSFLSLVVPMQRLAKRILERHIYRPFLEAKGLSILNVPKVTFTPPDEDRNEQALYYIQLVRGGLMKREAAARELAITPDDVPDETEMAALQPQGPNPQFPNQSPQQDTFNKNQSTETQLKEMLRRVTEHEVPDDGASDGTAY